MIIRRNSNRRGFSLTELVIVLGVIGVLMAGVFSYASSARQNVRVEQAVEAIATTADATRGAYGGRPNISGGISTVVPFLVQEGATPPNLLRPTGANCTNANSLCLDSPWGGAPGTYPAGTMGICAFNYILTGGGDTACNAGAASQYFSIEWIAIGYGSCVAVAQRVVPTSPAGLQDVYINGHSVVQSGTTVIAGGNALPISPTVATTWCAKGATANTIDFVYTLRPPLT